MTDYTPDPPEVLNSPVTTLDEAMTRNYPPPTAAPCVECPWRRVQAAGHLGPFTPEEWIEMAHGETPIACHRTIPEGGGYSAKTLQCRGAAIFRANVHKQPRNPTVVTGPEDKVRVFGTNAEFIEHHS